jgi:ribonuclease HII
MLRPFYEQNSTYEICIDEVGRGCLFGRTYVAAVVLPKDGSIDGTHIKDSKKYSSKKKIKNVSEYIKQNCLYYHIAYVENDVIDKVNILQAVMQGMHECIRELIQEIDGDSGAKNDFLAIIDGNYFKPYTYFDATTNCIVELPYITVEKGDATYMGIAAASILAKVARDEYVGALCEKYPLLKEQYQLHTNMGYGTKAHLEGIQKHGITNFHRISFRGTQSDLPPTRIENV